MADHCEHGELAPLCAVPGCVNGEPVQATGPTRQLSGGRVIESMEGGFPKGPKPAALRDTTTNITPATCGMHAYGCLDCVRIAAGDERARIERIIEAYHEQGAGDEHAAVVQGVCIDLQHAIRGGDDA